MIREINEESKREKTNPNLQIFMRNENNDSPKLSVEVIVDRQTFEVSALVDTGATISLINKKVKKEIERKIRELNDNDDKNKEIFPRIKTRRRFDKYIRNERKS